MSLFNGNLVISGTVNLILLFSMNEHWVSVMRVRILLLIRSTTSRYSTTKETHQSLFRAIMVKQLRNQYIFYTIFFNKQLCIKLLNNVIFLLKPVHAVRQCIDKFQTIGFH